MYKHIRECLWGQLSPHHLLSFHFTAPGCSFHCSSELTFPFWAASTCSSFRGFPSLNDLHIAARCMDANEFSQSSDWTWTGKEIHNVLWKCWADMLVIIPFLFFPHWGNWCSSGLCVSCLTAAIFLIRVSFIVFCEVIVCFPCLTGGVSVTVSLRSSSDLLSRLFSAILDSNQARQNMTK